MKILFVTLNPVEYATSSMYRNIGVINGLITLGHEVEVLTCWPLPNYPARNNYVFVNSIQINRLPVSSAYSNVVGHKEETWLKRFLYQIVRSLYHKLTIFDHTHVSACKADLKYLSSINYDVVISSSDPKSSHKAVQVLKRKGLRYQKWIQYWGDPMTIDITRKDILPNVFVRHLEYNLIKDADRIFYVSPFTFKEQCKLFPDLSGKMGFVPVPYTKPRTYKTDSNNSQKRVFKVGYFGAYPSKIRNILPLYEACRSLKGQVILHIVGGSDLDLRECENIIIEPRTDASTIEQYEAECDLLVCLMNNRGTQIPGKIYHCAATNKPILVILDGDSVAEKKDYLYKFNRFIFSLNNQADIKLAIKDIMNSKKKWQPSPEFAPETIAQQLLSD